MSRTGDALVDVYANTFADQVVAGRDADDDALFDELENFDDSAYRSARMQQLDREIKSIKQLSTDHGKYLEIKDEKEVLDVTTKNERVVVHFFHKDFQRCEIMHRHMETLAQKHIQTRFIKVDVDNVPFLVTKLQIQVLPCVIPFIKGIGKQRVLGFEGLGDDTFKTVALELLLLKSGVIRNVRGQADLQRPIMGFPDAESDSD